MTQPLNIMFEFDNAMTLCGYPSIADISPSLLLH